METDQERPTPDFQPATLPMLSALIEPALQECSANVADLVEALAEAQAAFPEIPKSRTGKISGQSANGNRYEYEYKYADISDVLRVCRPICGKNGIAISQLPTVETQKLSITTMLMRGNQWIRSTLTMSLMNPGRANPNQVLGGQITYLRRYSLCAMLGVQAEEDLDAQEMGASDNAPERITPKTGKSKSRSPQLDGCIDPDQQAKLRDGLAVTGIAVQELVDHVANEIGEDISPKNLARIPKDAFDIAHLYLAKKADQEAR